MYVPCVRLRLLGWVGCVKCLIDAPCRLVAVRMLAPGTFEVNRAAADGTFLVHSDETHEVTAAALKHTVPCVGYVVKEKDLQGHLDIAKVCSASL